MAKIVKSLRMESSAAKTLKEISSVSSVVYGVKISSNSLMELFIAEGMENYCERLLKALKDKDWASKYLRHTNSEELLAMTERLLQESAGYSCLLDTELFDSD